MKAEEIPILYTQLFINNEFVNSINGRIFSTYNPATEKSIAAVQEGDSDDIDAAVRAAQAAFKPGSVWREISPCQRGDLMRKFAALMRRDQDYLAKLEALDNGKPYSSPDKIEDALFNVDYGIKCIEYFAGWTDKIYGETIPVDNSYFCYTKHEAIGVCAGILTLCYPVLMFCEKLGPALATGNTIVIKPSEYTPLSALYCASLIREAGFPAGVVNVVPGFGEVAGKALALHMDVQKISFTGSIRIGKLVHEYAGKSNLKRVSLGLSGKSPLIVTKLDDCDLDKAVNEVSNYLFTNNGQSCVAPTRVFAHSSIYDKFLNRIKNKAELRKVGGQFDAETTLGPITKPDQFKKILSLIETGRKEGARLVTGGERIGEIGHFIQPTVFADVEDSMEIAKEEFLGPILCVSKYEEVDEVIERSNNTKYGLGAGVFTNDVKLAFKFSNALQAGSVFVNCFEAVFISAPFGGFKQSGIGRDLSQYAISEFTEVKNVIMRIQ